MESKENAADASGQSVVMPWAKRAKKLEQSEGPYCDYAAFCEWLEAWNERQEPSIQFDTDAVDKTSLYIAFSSACLEFTSRNNARHHRVPGENYERTKRPSHRHSE